MDKSFAYELLNDLKKQNKRLFIIWIITFLILVGVTCYTIYLVSDIGISEDIQEIENVNTINNSSLINGGN